MEEKQRAKVFSYLYMRNVYKKWKKTSKLSSRYLGNRRLNQELLVKKQVKETEWGLWKTAMDEKSAQETQNF